MYRVIRWVYPRVVIQRSVIFGREIDQEKTNVGDDGEVYRITLLRRVAAVLCAVALSLWVCSGWSVVGKVATITLHMIKVRKEIYCQWWCCRFHPSMFTLCSKKIVSYTLFLTFLLNNIQHFFFIGRIVNSLHFYSFPFQSLTCHSFHFPWQQHVKFLSLIFCFSFRRQVSTVTHAEVNVLAQTCTFPFPL